jgi:hypothetical protein
LRLLHYVGFDSPIYVRLTINSRVLPSLVNSDPLFGRRTAHALTRAWRPGTANCTSSSKAEKTNRCGAVFLFSIILRIARSRRADALRSLFLGIFETFSCLYGAVQAMTSEKFTGRRIMAEKKVWPSMTSVHVGLASWLPVSAIEASGLNLWDQAGAGWAGTLGGNGDAFI